MRHRVVPVEGIVFVYESTRKPYRTLCVYLGEKPIDRNRWTHVATIDPAAWIENLINNPKDRERHIEELMNKQKP